MAGSKRENKSKQGKMQEFLAEFFHVLLAQNAPLFYFILAFCTYKTKCKSKQFQIEKKMIKADWKQKRKKNHGLINDSSAYKAIIRIRIR